MLDARSDDKNPSNTDSMIETWISTMAADEPSIEAVQTNKKATVHELHRSYLIRTDIQRLDIGEQRRDATAQIAFHVTSQPRCKLFSWYTQARNHARKVRSQILVSAST